MPRPPRTLKGQLALLFLVLTLVPALLLTALATKGLLDALGEWHKPGVQRALDGSLEVARDLLDRTRNDLRQRGQLLASDPALTPPLDPERIRSRLAGANNLDFVQLYDEQGTLFLEVTRDPLLAPPAAGERPERIRSLARSERPFLEDRKGHILAYAGFAGAPGENDWVLVTGIHLDENFYARLDDLSEAVANYRQVPTLITVRQGQVLLSLMLVVLFLGLAAVVTARRLAGRVSRPVEHLARSMQSLAREEEVSPLPPEGPEEMERLIDTFNAMSRELSRSRRELARAERLSAWREVARRVAHEMKNALTPITFSAHRLKKSAALLPEGERARYQAALATVLEEVEGLQRLAATFSELARLPVPEVEPVDRW
jgi:nitrogen fixation/metabolism regulation signal transduction histidine kinase